MIIARDLLALSCLAPAALAAFSLLIRPSHRLSSALFFGIGCLLILASVSSWGTVIDWQAPAWVAIGFVPVSLKSDSLTSIFVLLLGVVSTCCAIYSPNYLQHLGSKIVAPIYWSALFAFVAGMAGVLLSANAVVFLVAWEVMSLSSAALVVSEFRQRKARRAAFIYVVATRIATIFLSAGFLMMYVTFNDWSFAAWQFSDPHTWPAAFCILLGLIIKGGVWPFHIWLPYAHPEAPSPVSALMSGVMVKIPIYACIRFFVIGHLTCQPLLYAIFAIACISAFWGVLFAINQHDVKRLLAYSTVENVSLILIGLIVCIWARNVGLMQIAELSLTGVILHCWAHGLFKSSLFLCAGSINQAAHTRDFAHLGGLGKVMPHTFAAFVIGSAAICALPPLIGFGSKWYLYQALLQSAFKMHSLTDRAVCLAAIGVLAAVGALAIACFVKAIGVAFLGNARSNTAADASEVAQSMTSPQILLAAAGILMGIFTPQVVLLISPLVTDVAGSNLAALPANSVQFGQLAAALIVLIGATYALVLYKTPRRYITWDCGFGTFTARSQVTADSFAQPIARIFTPVLKYHVEIDISGPDRRHFPEKIHVEPLMDSLLETRVYGPAARAISKLSWLLTKFQAGSIHLYLTYVCATLIILLVMGTQVW